MSGNPSLKTLSCPENKLTELDLSGNPALERVDCSGNNLTALDLSNNPSLITLTCSGNKLTGLDLSGDGALSWLDCTGCGLTGLNLSNNPALREARRADYSNVPMTVSGGVYTFDPCDGDVIVFYTAAENNMLHMHIPNAPKDIDGAGGSENGGGDTDGEDPDEEVAEETIDLSLKLVNNTDAVISVALAGWTDSSGFTRGWFNVAPGQEKTMSFPNVSSSYEFGFYATSRGGKRVWGGKPGDARYAGSFWVHQGKAFNSSDGEPIEGGQQVHFKRLSVSKDGKATIKFAVKK